MAPADPDLRARALLSLQRALVGEITPGMRFIGLELGPARLHVRVWHDGPVATEVEEGFDAAVVTQVVADFAWPERGDPAVSFEFIRCDAPAAPAFQGELVYGRREPQSP